MANLNYKAANGYFSTVFRNANTYARNSAETVFTLGTGDFTIEFWYYQDVQSTANRYLVDFRAANGLFPTIYISTASVLIYYQSTAVRITGTTVIQPYTWYHIALCRSSGTTRLFLNGTQEGSNYTDASNYAVGASRPVYNSNGIALGGEGASCLITNLRILKGQAPYTTTFTPSTTPLTSNSSTSLLTCQDSSLLDRGANTLTVTASDTLFFVDYISPFARSNSSTLNITGGVNRIDQSGSGDQAYSLNKNKDAYVFYDTLANNNIDTGIKSNSDRTVEGAAAQDSSYSILSPISGGTGTQNVSQYWT